jgi:tRNA dimethylallyltransferase
VQAYRTIGVPEAFEVLEGKITREQFVPIVTARTWQLVRRQMAWFRRDTDVHWIDVSERTSQDVADQILSPRFGNSDDIQVLP